MLALKSVVSLKQLHVGIEFNKHRNGPLPADHNAALPFTRFVVGHADYTPILYTNPGPTSLAHQLATPVLYLSPLQVFAEHPDTMMTSPIVKDALPVLQSISAVWDETIVLPGSKIGELAAFARRNGDDWIVGIVNGGRERFYELDLSFLPDGDYEAVTVSDDLTAEPVNVSEIGLNIKADGKRKGWTTAVPFSVDTRSVDRFASLTIKLAEGGGFVARIVRQ